MRSRVRIYWGVWLAMVAIGMLLRFTVFRKTPPEQRFPMGCIYIGATYLIVLVLGLVEDFRVNSFLHMHYYEKWKVLTHLPGVGPGCVNNYRMLAWVFSREDSSNPVLHALKKDYRRLFWFMFVAFCGSGLMLFFG